MPDAPLPALPLSFVALALSAVMVGCATLQYQTTVRLIPLADAQGRACLPAYDACFLGCGGQRVSETVCIRNCPPEK